MRHRTWIWLVAGGLFLALAACDDEIVDVDLPKDASADRAADARPEANGEAAATNDGTPAEDADASQASEADETSEPGEADAADVQSGD